MVKLNALEARLSPTSIQSFYENGCPWRWRLERDYRPKKPNVYAERGVLVHSMMEGKIDPKKVTDKTALAFYEKLIGLESIQKEVIFSELQQDIELDRGELGKFVLRRRIDRIARMRDGSLAIIDFKTNYGYGWLTLKAKDKNDKTIPNNVIPQRFTFQGPGYLLPPRVLPNGLEEWPQKLLYMVTPLRGAPAPLLLKFGEVDWESWWDALDMILSHVRKDMFPKVQGKQCLDCPMNGLCYELKGAKSSYEKRKD